MSFSVNAINILAKRIKDRQLPSANAPIVEDAALRESLESILEHLRMYEGDSKAPGERFITIEELETAGAIGTTLVQGFRAITTFNGLPVPKVSDQNIYNRGDTSGTPGNPTESGGIILTFEQTVSLVDILDEFFLTSSTADTAEGQITFEVDPYIFGAFPSGVALRLDETTDAEVSIRFGHLTDDQYFGLDANSDFAMGITPSLGSVFWHDDNDGPASGLDADTVDGIQGATIMLFSGAQIPDLVDLEDVTNVGLADDDVLQYDSGSSEWKSESVQTMLGAGLLYYLPDVKSPQNRNTGDLMVVNSDGPNLWDELSVGTDTHVLTADSGEALGVKWAAPANGAPLILLDNEELQFGTGSDALVDFNGTNLIWNMVAGEFIVQRGGTGVLQTQQFNATGNTTGAQVLDHGSVMRDVGMNDLNPFNFNASDTLEARHAGAATGKTDTSAYTLTGPTSSDVDFGTGKIATVFNLGSSVDYTIADTGTCTMFYCDGTAAPVDIVGSGVLAPGGVVTLWRFSTTAIYIFGSGFTA